MDSSDSQPGDLRRRGRARREAVLGAAHVAAADTRTGPLDAPFQELIEEAAWGRVWSRPEWTARERSMVTIALLAALGHREELAMHLRAGLRTGLTRTDVTEAMLHVAIYAGVPAANSALATARAVLAELAAAGTPLPEGPPADRAGPTRLEEEP